MDAKEQWKELANQLGLQFKEGINGLLESETLQKLEDQMISPEIPDFLKNGIIQKLLASVFLGMVTGKYREYEVFLYRGVTSHADNRHTYYTKVNLAFPKPLDAGLEVRPLGFWDRLYRGVFGGNSVLTGNQSFDSLLWAGGKEKNRVQRMLEKQDVQDKLVHFFQAFPGAKMKDEGISYRGLGEIFTADEAKKILDALVDTAIVFQPQKID